ncbi:hypothetical protein NE236_26355 [Actinoallomurus purpureus]|uniref:hypothetical protein n=1 Tax=Actinoallomurus purpureus TaxID=478114 RepID=UPI00209364D6|nr:hypothetical protein [Actinoallomurus purpureus]MCO6008503.1 hypothetical protein [Actinoallomurus purpureus]
MKTTHRIGTIAATGVLAATTIAGTATAGTATGSSITPCLTTTHQTPTAANVARFIAGKRRTGAAQQSIDEALSTQYGLTRAQTASSAGVVSPRDITSHGLTVASPYIYSQTCTQDVFLDGPWHWSNNFSDVADGTHYDGIALGFNTSIHMTGSSACHWGDSFGVNCSLDSSMNDGANGRGMNFKNRVAGSDGSAKYGDGIISFNGGGICGNYWGFSSYAHGALGNNITGWAFTGGMLEADFSNMSSSVQWTVASDVHSNSVYTC